ncbi:DNA mismatch repair protein MutS [Alkalilimnicola ehrlichii]|uniref:DNA mismatch repair protein MutS n=1 Tax=Alkalilimnicola ehrlichii TaxID=351052 RepID=A0A3E0WPG2_9GAMM|nr:Smr/MutS family protein [Alkalilimnicola ehrlichii]RFA28263.1 DNA mismatch repair protein MutS [Alkalilimnicola ehrlichii]RFA34864.1 DNA mismatch repair protein MutS [Alkalilimnicola ehrlichii]
MQDDDPDDRRLFEQAMQGVRRLATDKVVPATPRPAPVPRKTVEDEQQVMRDILSDLFEPADLATGEELEYARPGLQHRVLRKLRRGQYSVQSELDLHGLTVPLARIAVADFLKACGERKLRCVRIIHGKGRRSSNKGPVLKTKVEHWLRQRDEVLAFCSARQVDGGTGAVYVLLRRQL